MRKIQTVIRIQAMNSSNHTKKTTQKITQKEKMPAPTLKKLGRLEDLTKAKKGAKGDSGAGVPKTRL